MHTRKQRRSLRWRWPLTVAIIGMVGFSACKQDEYYTDGGLANPYFDGSIMAYLDAHPRQLDTIAQIVRLAGLEDVFEQEAFTFFSPQDEDIKQLIGAVNYQGEDPSLTSQNGANPQLYRLGLDTIQTLADIDSALWRKYLQRHMFHGRKLLKDYPQVDFDVINTFGGENYFSFSNTVSNIGVVFNDAVTGSGANETRLKYMGYRQLHISYIRNISDPDPADWNPQKVASSDIQPSNGVVHVLDFTSGDGFGFSQYEVIADIIQSKR